MADDKEKVIEAKKGKQTRSLVAALMVISVLVMVLTPLVTIYLFRAMVKKADEEVKRVVVQATEVALPRIQVNIADSNGARYAQLEIVVEVSDSSMREFLAEQGPGNPRGRQKRIMASIISLVGDKTLNALLSTDGKRQLASEIRAAINELLSKDTSGMVTDVYFSGFLVQ